ncbi:hypothetical protein HPB48_018241 [Haemaphysalis longicornis]|uniref:Uncharacterized protein n=1 Tax=Haemaphysalis longicornis TaxID=44386 RepID=A0A9J6FCQ4_HAELO|nr:hypothetical protein HPB48_018241 [Haemaphysalis longicornis]
MKYIQPKDAVITPMTQFFMANSLFYYLELLQDQGKAREAVRVPLSRRRAGGSRRVDQDQHSWLVRPSRNSLLEAVERVKIVMGMCREKYLRALASLFSGAFWRWKMKYIQPKDAVITPMTQFFMANSLFYYLELLQDQGKAREAVRVPLSRRRAGGSRRVDQDQHSWLVRPSRNSLLEAVERVKIVMGMCSRVQDIAIFGKSCFGVYSGFCVLHACFARRARRRRMVVTRSKGASMDKDSNADDPPGPLETIGNGPERKAPPGVAGGEQETLLPTVASDQKP